MKKSVLLLLLLAFSSVTYAQEPWRTLTLSTTNGTNFNGKFISTSSANISYEMRNKFSLESWTGLNYDFSSKSGWMSNQTTLNKSYNSLTIGVGVLYNSGFVNLIQEPTNQTYGIVTIRKRFKL
tara:strand:- start:109 stop:480 length:372 start_codon:yes stop_codon:yes gene_type:complete